jgi:cbb3-type cytochrome oxidase maturation protein
MSVLFIALPVALLLGGSAVLAFVLSVRGGQFDDLDTPPQRMLFDEVEARGPPAGVARVGGSETRAPGKSN